MNQYTVIIFITGLPEDFGNRDWKPPTESPCLIKYLCDKHEGLEIEAKVIKEHWWKPHIKKLFDKKVSFLDTQFKFIKSKAIIYNEENLILFIFEFI